MAGQGAQCVGGLSEGDGVVGVGHPPAAPQQDEGQVLVLGQRAAAEPAGLQDQMATPRADRAGHHRDAIEQRESPAVDVLARHVLDRLPARDQVDPVAHFGVPRHGPHVGVGQPRDQSGDGAGGEHRVGVQGDDDLAGGPVHAPIEGAGFAAVGLAEQPHLRMVAEDRGQGGECAVGGPVVHDHDLERGVLLGQQGYHGPAHHPLLVIGRNHHGHRGSVGVVRGAARVATRGALADGQAQDPEEPGNAEHHRDEEHGVQAQFDPPCDRERRQVHEPAQRGVAGQRGHRLVPADAGEGGDGGEREAAGAQRVDERPQRPHRLIAVAAAVVQQDHVAAAQLIEAAADDRVHAGLGPVPRVVPQPDRDVAQVLGDGDRHQLVGSGRLGVPEVGRPEQRGAAVGDRFD